MKSNLTYTRIYYSTFLIVELYSNDKLEQVGGGARLAF